MIRFAFLDYLAALRERKIWLVAALFAYAVLGVPVLLARPPAHVTEAMTAWFGAQDRFALFLYLWIDLSMNKVIAIVSVVLAGGIVVRERDTGVLPVLAAKPISLPRYFVVRAVSACAVMATLYVAAHLVGAVYFAWRVEGFRPGVFLAAMSLHLFAAIFATALSAAIAVWVGRRGLGVLVALLALSTLVGTALLGFYNPAWRRASLVNPIALGAEALAHLDALRPEHLLVPMFTLSALTALAIAAGALAVRRMEG
ncbi:hypothetical protein [Sorangium sp. So ce131]|uniref:hypothetical protein n=1 Tax=Sorangium sp. So ce131 TaxID=3133282 RepID=UPI003F5EA001